MAFIGLPFYGYCPITVTTNDDGSETESLGAGKITRAVISYTFYSTSSPPPSKPRSPLLKLLLTKPSPLTRPTPWCKRATEQASSWTTNGM